MLYPGDVTFIHFFRIGRSEGCEVRCYDRSVSRVHLDVLFESGQWWVQYHHSRNGTFVDGQKIDRQGISDSCQLKLGHSGPTVSLRVEALHGNPTDFSAFPKQDSTFVSDVPSKFPLGAAAAIFEDNIDGVQKGSVKFEAPDCVSAQDIEAEPATFRNVSTGVSDLMELQASPSEKNVVFF